MKKHIHLILTALALVILFSACTGDTNGAIPSTIPTKETAMEPVYKTISPADAKELIGSEGAVLVDVRTPEEYMEAYIPGAVLLPLDDIAQKAERVLPDKYATIIVYCRSGRRSAIAAEELLDMGYKKIYDLGGIIDWPYETTDS
jgi:rhodanese-related sulfurtransferase